ncbi:hypothetical protein L2E82_43386 [Cichorium intybus]|uniref:Uncharacterized protein n=1 Tax=Cichorium intybus TaxID=13427 RepID=A0ACB8ZMK7_CICIN|nr:hypothetical protein L2E82_43386 [Cichorium intybus]
MTTMDMATMCHQFPSEELATFSGKLSSSSDSSDHDQYASDLVAFQISLLGDHHIGKTSFLILEREDDSISRTEEGDACGVTPTESFEMVRF